MKLLDQTLSISPTDLANFHACRHKAALDARAARGELTPPDWSDPFVDTLRARGEEHERQYIDRLRHSSLRVVDLSAPRGGSREVAVQGTLAAMRDAADVIVQAPLGDARWFGYADVLLKTPEPSELGDWSYEVHDTKLARETKAGTILQLCVYTELVGALQGRPPEWFRVVTPLAVEAYRFDAYAAFYRSVKARLNRLLEAEAPGTYPDPVDHCEICRWWSPCNRRRRQDDHLRFVAGLGRVHQTELVARDVPTLAALAELVPIPFRPTRGSRETYEKLRHQASLQKRQRDTGRPVHELLPVVPGLGLSLLPEPTPHDIFFDIEGDPFAREGGREYLFGLGVARGDGGFEYSSRWAFTDAEERAAFEAVVDRMMTALETSPDLHVFHYGAYEASALKRLAGRHATREQEVDRLLRGDRLVDLYAVVRHALRAGVESYSIKSLEPFYEFRREVELGRAGDHRRVVEIGLETGNLEAITRDVRAAVEGYNRDDCRSTLELRGWLESLRSEQLAGGIDVRRPSVKDGEPGDKVRERDRRALELRAAILARPGMVDFPDVPEDRTPEQQALYLLAYLVDWHRREERVAWGEFHRLREMSDEDLFEEDEAIVRLRFVERVFEPPSGGRKKRVTDRYAFPDQGLEIRVGSRVKLRDDTGFGTIEALNRQAGTIDIEKNVNQTDVHPETLIVESIVSAQEQESSIHRTAARIIEVGLDDQRGDRVVNDLLLARPPRLTSGDFALADGEDATSFAVRVGSSLNDSLFAIQGPPGAGKTYTGAKMIAALAAAGLRIGVISTAHRVIRKLLVEAAREAGRQGVTMAVAHKPGRGETLDQVDDVTVLEPSSNESALAWLRETGGRVLGGVAWLWSPMEAAKSVDVLFVDEAGQFSLANTLAVAQAGRSLVLLGDPQQLRQPKKGSHPDGVDVSALDHMLGGHRTMPAGRGIFLPTTWRLAPTVCDFTSEAFYERRLHSEPRLERQVLAGTGRFDGAGLWVVEVAHEGNRNASREEADVVADIVRELLKDGSTWTDLDGVVHPMTPKGIRVLAPFNAQVTRVREALAKFELQSSNFEVGQAKLPVGTVDKFQGQEAPVAIYSMGTSHPDDAPRGMEFLYSLNRLNVATSRARCAAILVASPRLFEPECRTPAQMRLANALCRFREMARVIQSEASR